MQPGQLNKAGAHSFSLESFLDPDSRTYQTEKVKVKINGKVVEKTLKEVYEYIENEYSNTINPNKQKFLTDHQKLINNEYVLLGYHGTNEIAALSIMLNSLQPSTNFKPSQSHWHGVYAADNLKLALGYAVSPNYKEYDHTRILAVYAKKKDIKDIGITAAFMSDIFDADKKGFKLNQKASSTIISGKDSGFDVNELIIKKDIELKTAILPIITKDDFEAVANFFKLQEFAQKIITNANSIPFINDIANIEHPELAGLSQENKQTVQDILKLNKLVSKLDGLLRPKTKNTIEIQNTIKEIKNIFMPENRQSVLSDLDLNEIRDYFSRQNNLFIAVNDFRLIKDTLKLKNLPDNALRNARALLKLPNLSNNAFKRIQINLVHQEDLMEAIEYLKLIRKFADKNNLKTPLLSDDEAANLRNINKEEIFKFPKDVLIDELTEINNFEGKQDFANKSAVDDLAKVLALKDVSKDDVKSVIGYFLVNENNVLSAVEDFKVIQDIITLKHLPDNALVKARELLKIPRLSEIGFKKGIKDYFLAQHNLFDSVKILKVLRDDKENSPPVDKLKNLLSLSSQANFDKILNSVFPEIKNTISNNFKIPLEHPLLNSKLDKAGESGSATISYYTPARQTRSSEPKPKHKVTNLQDGQIKKDARGRDQFDSRNQLSYVKSSASTSYLRFWPVTIAKKATTAFSSFLSIGWLYKMYSYEPVYPDRLTQSEEWVEGRFSILEVGDQGLKTANINGLLNLALLLVRKFTGYTPKASRVLSNQHEMNIKFDIQSTALVNEFLDAVLKHAKSCGIASCISDIFEDSDYYFNSIQLVRQKLAAGKLKEIPQLLYLNLVQNKNMKEKLQKSAQAHANKLLTILANDVPNLQQKFLKYQPNWLVDAEHPGRTMSTYAWNKANILNQEVSVRQQQELVGQQCQVLMTDVTNTEMNTTISQKSNAYLM